MAQTQRVTFTHKDLAAALVRAQDLHEGFWMVTFSFGIHAANVPIRSTQDILPSAVVPIMGVALERCEAPNPLTVDAAEVNSRIYKPQIAVTAVSKPLIS